MQPGAQRRTFSESGWTGALAGVLIVLAAFAAYHNCFTAPFVFDDEWAVIRNPTIRDLREVLRLKPDFTPAREMLDRLGASAPGGAEQP